MTKTRIPLLVTIILTLSLVTGGILCIAPLIAPPAVVAIGDSIMAGHGLPRGHSWVDLVASGAGWKFTNLAADGSGFDKVGNAGGTFDDQVSDALSLRPALIIISGSSNDLGTDSLVLDQRTSATIERIHDSLPSATVVGVSAIWGSAPLPAQLIDIDQQVATATTAAHGLFVSIGQPLSGHPELVQPDGVHPTAVGQARIEQNFLNSIRRTSALRNTLVRYLPEVLPPVRRRGPR